MNLREAPAAGERLYERELLAETEYMRLKATARAQRELAARQLEYAI